MSDSIPSHEQTTLEELRAFLGENTVLVDLPDKLAYARDCWPQGIILVRGQQRLVHQPLCIVRPRTEEEVCGVVRICAKYGVPVIPFGAGSGVCGGTVPTRGGVIIDVKHLREIHYVDTERMLVSAGAGIIGMDLETRLNQQGLTLGHYPSSLYCSTLGGYLAARSAGQQSSLYGKIEDMVQSARLVDGQGEVYDTAPAPGADAWKGGDDLTQLVVGSEGTLGVFTRGTLRIFPTPTHRFYRGFRCPTLEEGVRAQRRVMQAGLRPCVMRLYDEFDTLIAGQGKTNTKVHAMEDLPTARLLRRRGIAIPDKLMAGLVGAASKALPADTGWISEVLPDFGSSIRRAAQGLLGRAIGQPLLLNQLADALPGGCLMVVGFEGDETAEIEAEAGFALLREHGFDLGEQPGLHWLENRFNVSYKQSPMFDAGAFVDTMEVATTWSRLMELYYGVKEAVAPHAFLMAHFSHAYDSGASIYFTFAGFGQDTEHTLQSYKAAWNAAQEAVVQLGGCVSHHHGVGVSKASRTHYDHEGGEPIFEMLKRRLDPKMVMNPGKVWVEVPHVA